jgi:hypothetical protein|tara:strand:+ start:56 stop:337 length:282 start_codon:yes stop_codon:yes gene_type:complete
MTNLYNTGHSTTFQHCAREGCLYHAVPGSDYCEADEALACKHLRMSTEYQIVTDDYVGVCPDCGFELITDHEVSYYGAMQLESIHVNRIPQGD